MNFVGQKPLIPEAAYREAMAVPKVNSRRPPGSVAAIALKHGCCPLQLVQSMYRGIKRYDIRIKQEQQQ